jgi:hypothetical protein
MAPLRSAAIKVRAKLRPAFCCYFRCSHGIRTGKETKSKLVKLEFAARCAVRKGIAVPDLGAIFPFEACQFVTHGDGVRAEDGRSIVNRPICR